MSRPTPVEIIKHTAVCALAKADVLVPEWLPEGKRRNGEWVALNPIRGDRHAGSFGVSLETGRWHDFADCDARGGDLVSLLAYLRECGQLDAAREIDQRLGLGLFTISTADSRRLQERRLAADLEHQARLDNARQSLAMRQQEVALQARQLWQMSKPADPANEYLKRKGVPPFRLRQQRHGSLLVPIGCDGVLRNLQVIAPSGRKSFLTDGQVQGCYSPLGRVTPGTRLYICEGWATGATIHAETGSAVVCAMNAANLLPVAAHIREKLGESVDMVIAGDDDRQQRGNPGRRAATQAAEAIGASVVFPEWSDDAPPELSDFNDLLIWRRRKGGAQ